MPLMTSKLRAIAVVPSCPHRQAQKGGEHATVHSRRPGGLCAFQQSCGKSGGERASTAAHVGKACPGEDNARTKSCELPGTPRLRTGRHAPAPAAVPLLRL